MPGLKVIWCIKSVTNAQELANRQAKSNMPHQLFQSWGHKMKRLGIKLFGEWLGLCIRIYSQALTARDMELGQGLSHLMTKPTKWLCDQQRLKSAWASAQSDQSSLSAWRKLGSLPTHWADSEDSDQTGPMPRLIYLCWAHSHFVGFVMRRLNCSIVISHDIFQWNNYDIDKFQYVVINEIFLSSAIIAIKESFFCCCFPYTDNYTIMIKSNY